MTHGATSTTTAELDRAVALLRAGDLVAFPTETVYGLGADARQLRAVEKIFAAKGRPADHPLIVHLPSMGDLPHWAALIPPAAWVLAHALWPGPLTMVLQRHPSVLREITGGQESIALRMPRHPLAQALLRAFGHALVAPSANPFGYVSPTTAEHVRQGLGGKVAMVLDGGPCEVGLESTIVDLTGDVPRLLRRGPVSQTMLAGLLQRPVLSVAHDVADVRAPGMLTQHYAPHLPLQLCTRQQIVQQWRERQEKICYVLVTPPTVDEKPPIEGVRVLGPNHDEYARQLYATLREIDAEPWSRMVIEQPPSASEWDAIADRLRRASKR